MKTIPFVKYHGAGNDFILIDERDRHYDDALSQKAVAHMCHRHFGVGADGLMRLQKSDKADFHMLYYNADGNASSLCGNGSRCIVAFARRLGLITDFAQFETSDGIHEAWVLNNGNIKLRMQIPHGYQDIDAEHYFIDTGSPHHVQFLGKRAVEDVNILEEGAALRHHERYAPGGTNANFIHVVGPDKIKVRTFERGVENETLSCGTGVTACAYIHLLLQERTEGTVAIHTPGGELAVEVKGRSTEDEQVYLIGPAEYVFEGEIAV